MTCAIDNSFATHPDGFRRLQEPHCADPLTLEERLAALVAEREAITARLAAMEVEAAQIMSALATRNRQQPPVGAERSP